jgi:hypothetical protein
MNFNYFLSTNLTMVDFNLTIKDHIHGLVVNYGLIMNKTSIYLASYEFLLNTSCLHPNLKYFNPNLKDNT